MAVGAVARQHGEPAFLGERVLLPSQRKLLEIGSNKWRRADGVDVKLAALFLSMETEVCMTMHLTRKRGRNSLPLRFFLPLLLIINRGWCGSARA